MFDQKKYRALSLRHREALEIFVRASERYRLASREVRVAAGGMLLADQNIRALGVAMEALVDESVSADVLEENTLAKGPAYRWVRMPVVPRVATANAAAGEPTPPEAPEAPSGPRGEP